MENVIFEPYTSPGDDIFCPSITMTRIICSLDCLVTGWCTLTHLMEATSGRKERYIYYHQKTCGSLCLPWSYQVWSIQQHMSPFLWTSYKIEPIPWKFWWSCRLKWLP